MHNNYTHPLLLCCLSLRIIARLQKHYDSIQGAFMDSRPSLPGVRSLTSVRNNNGLVLISDHQQNTFPGRQPLLPLLLL